jgi:hypothetical protein
VGLLTPYARIEHVANFRDEVCILTICMEIRQVEHIGQLGVESAPQPLKCFLCKSFLPFILLNFNCHFRSGFSIITVLLLSAEFTLLFLRFAILPFLLYRTRRRLLGSFITERSSHSVDVSCGCILLRQWLVQLVPSHVETSIFGPCKDFHLVRHEKMVIFSAAVSMV